MEVLHQKGLVKRWVKQQRFFEKPTNDDVEVWEEDLVDVVAAEALVGDEVGLAVVAAVVDVESEGQVLVLLRAKGHPMVLRVNMDLDEPSTTRKIYKSINHDLCVLCPVAT